MGIAEVLTIVFIVLKLTGVIGWSWWLVLLPEIIAFGIYIFWIVFIGVIGAKKNKLDRKNNLK